MKFKKPRIAFAWTLDGAKSTVSMATILKNFYDGSDPELDALCAWARTAKPGDVYTCPIDGATFTTVSN